MNKVKREHFMASVYAVLWLAALTTAAIIEGIRIVWRKLFW